MSFSQLRRIEMTRTLRLHGWARGDIVFVRTRSLFVCCQFASIYHLRRLPRAAAAAATAAERRVVWPLCSDHWGKSREHNASSTLLHASISEYPTPVTVVTTFLHASHNVLNDTIWQKKKHWPFCLNMRSILHVQEYFLPIRNFYELLFWIYGPAHKDRRTDGIFPQCCPV